MGAGDGGGVWEVLSSVRRESRLQTDTRCRVVRFWWTCSDFPRKDADVRLVLPIRVVDASVNVLWEHLLY